MEKSEDGGCLVGDSLGKPLGDLNQLLDSHHPKAVTKLRVLHPGKRYLEHDKDVFLQDLAVHIRAG